MSSSDDPKRELVRIWRGSPFFQLWSSIKSMFRYSGTPSEPLSKQITGWAVVSVVVGCLIGAGIGVLSMTPPEFIIAKVCFVGAAVIVLAKASHWLSNPKAHKVERMVLSFVIFGTVGALLIWSLTWVRNRQQIYSDNERSGNSVLKSVDTSGRRLSAWQSVRLSSAISQFGGSKILILTSKDEESIIYADDFRRAFTEAGWIVIGPLNAPSTEMIMDVQFSVDNFVPPLPKTGSLLEVLRQMGIKTADRYILAENVPRGAIVLWVGPDSPSGWHPQGVPPPTVPRGYADALR